MKHTYLTFRLSACFILCLLLCGNLSAQSVTTFEVQRPDFMSEPGELQLVLRDPASSDKEYGREYNAIYNSETGKYEVFDLNESADWLICANYSNWELYSACTYVLPYSFAKHVTAGENVKLDLRNAYHQCNVTVKDYNGNPFSNILLQEYPYGSSYSLDQEGKLRFYMPDVTWDFVISASGYFPVKKSITMAGADRNLTFAFNDCKKVNLKVADYKGDAMADTYVTVSKDRKSCYTATDENGEAIVFLPEGDYEVFLQATGYWRLEKKIVVNSTTKTVNLSYEGYRHLLFKVENGGNTDIQMTRFYLYTQSAKDDYGPSCDGNSYYLPEGLYMYEAEFDATSARRGLIQVGNSDVEEVLDFSDYKKAIIECSQDVGFISVYDPAKDDEEPIWRISFPDYSYPEEGETPEPSDKTAIVYLPAGEYEINGYNTPQTSMKIQLNQSEQRFVYNTPALEQYDVEVNFINSPVDTDELRSWYADFTPKGYQKSMYVGPYSLQLPAGEYSYKIEHGAYNGYGFSKEGTCKVDADNRVLNVDLKDYHCVRFNILTPDGEEVEYPIVELFKDDKSFMSEEGGEYLLENGNYRALVWDENDTEVFQKWVSFTVSGKDQVIDVQFERANTSLVFTEVKNEMFEPVTNAAVVIAGKTPDYTRENYALFTNIPCGKNNYTISIGGIQVQAGTVEVSADESLDITFYIDSSATGVNDRTEGKLSMIQLGDKLLLFSENGEPYQVSIYNINGNKVLERRMNGDGELFVDSFGSGIYILQIVKSGHVKTFKFVKK